MEEVAFLVQGLSGVMEPEELERVLADEGLKLRGGRGMGLIATARTSAESELAYRIRALEKRIEALEENERGNNVASEDETLKMLLDMLVEERAERDDARNAARALWMMWSFAEKEDRDKGLAHALRADCPWLKDE